MGRVTRAGICKGGHPSAERQRVHAAASCGVQGAPGLRAGFQSTPAPGAGHLQQPARDHRLSRVLPSAAWSPRAFHLLCVKAGRCILRFLPLHVNLESVKMQTSGNVYRTSLAIEKKKKKLKKIIEVLIENPWTLISKFSPRVSYHCFKTKNAGLSKFRVLGVFLFVFYLNSQGSILQQRTFS